MTHKVCSVSGCGRSARALMLCTMHYHRFNRTGEIGSAESMRPGISQTCSADDCDSLTRSSGSPYCEKHYYRMRRNGQLGTTKRWRQTGGPCAVAGCEDTDVDTGMCSRHATRMRRHGDPQVCIQPEDRKKLLGPDNPSWTGDEATYEGMHQRVRAAKGSARKHACTDCGKPARHWSYDRADPNEQTGDKGLYSLDIGHYVPRCVSCHKTFDLAAINSARAHSWQRKAGAA